MPPTILLVDDSMTSRAVNFAYLFSLLGSNVHCLEAERGDQALEILETQAVDLVLLDLTMPGMSGFDVLAEMRTRNMRSQVVVISADMQHGTRERVAALGAIGFIAKPIRLEVLDEMLTKMGVVHE